MGMASALHIMVNSLDPRTIGRFSVKISSNTFPGKKQMETYLNMYVFGENLTLALRVIDTNKRPAC